MHVCGKCSQPFSGDSCPSCGSSVRFTRVEHRKTNQTFGKIILTAIFGFLGTLAGTYHYRPVDDGAVLCTGLAILFIPLLIHLILAAFHRLQLYSGSLKKLYQTAAVTLAISGVLLFANGALDRHAPQRVEATVVLKHRSGGRSSYYTLYLLPSWRGGHHLESLGVGSATFNDVQIGTPVHLTVHRGFFGLSWYSDLKFG